METHLLEEAYDTIEIYPITGKKTNVSESMAVNMVGKLSSIMLAFTLDVLEET
jgi:hypothetical protein